MMIEKYIDWTNTKRRKGTFAEDWDNAALGFAGELGEICEMFKKHKYHGHELDKESLKLELGDLLFYFVWIWELQFKRRYDLLTAVCEQDFFTQMSELASQFFDKNVWRNDFLIALGAIEEFADMHLDLTLNDIIKANVDKLEARYPGGFSEEKSRERVT